MFPGRMTLIAAIVALTTALLSAREPAGPWQQKLSFELLLNEGYYSSNWTGSEQTSGSATATLSHTAAKQLAEKLRFEHGLDLAFGQLLSYDTLADKWSPSKSEDQIRLDDLLRFTLGLWVDPLLDFQLKSQFVDATAAPTECFNPVDLLETGGVGRKFFDDSTRTLSSQVGASAHQLFNARDTATISDVGVSWISAFRTIVFSQDAEYSTKLVLYKPLFNLGGGGEIGTWPQLDWEHALTARFNKALSGKAYVQLLYDENIDKNLRFKQALGLGLSLAWSSGS